MEVFLRMLIDLNQGVKLAYEGIRQCAGLAEKGGQISSKFGN